MKKKILDNFNRYIQREYSYLYNCMDIMKKTVSRDANVETLKLHIEESLGVHFERIETSVLYMLDNLDQYDLDFIDNGPIKSYENEEYIYIPKGTTKIEDSAFANNKRVKTVEVPEGVIEIGERAFEGCENLETVILPKGLKSIMFWAFYGCKNLKEIIVPDSVTLIKFGAFGGCDSLTDITLPFVGREMKAEELHLGVFGYIFGDGNQDDFMSRSELLYAMSDGSGLTSQIAEYDAPHSFYYYAIPQSLRRVTITKQEIIPDSAFKNCDLIEEIILPDNVQEVYNNAFEGCDSLNVLSPLWVDIKFADRGEKADFEIKNKCLVKYVGNREHIKIPYGITQIGGDAFYNCKQLKNAIVPGSVTEINEYAFQNCENLQSVVIPDSVKSISTNAFQGCSSLKKVVLGGGIKTLCKIFSGLPIEEIELREGITQIGGDAFYNCKQLKNAIVPGSVTEINEYAFQNCENLQSVVIPDSVKSISTNAFQGCSSLKKVVLGGGIKTLCKIFSGLPIEEIELREGITQIGGDAFYNCKQLKNVIVPGSVTWINEYAFQNCENLQSVVIPDSVKSISTNAFQGCSSLTKIVLKGTDKNRLLALRDAMLKIDMSFSKIISFECIKQCKQRVIE